MKDFIKRNKEYIIAVAMIAALFLFWFGVSKKMIVRAEDLNLSDDVFGSITLDGVSYDVKDNNFILFDSHPGEPYGDIYVFYNASYTSRYMLESYFTFPEGWTYDKSRHIYTPLYDARNYRVPYEVTKIYYRGTEPSGINNVEFISYMSYPYLSITQHYDSSIPSPVVILNYDAARKPTSFSVQTDPLNRYKIKLSIKHRSLLNEEIPDYEELFDALGDLQYISESNDMRSILNILEPRFFYPGVINEFTFSHNSSSFLTFPEVLDESTYYIDSWYLQNTWVSTTHMASLVRYVTGRISSLGFTFVDETNGHYGKTYTINYDLKGNIISQSETITSVPTDGEYMSSLEQRIDELIQQNDNLQQQVDDLQYAGDEISGLGEDGNILSTFQNILSTVTGVFRAMPQFFALLATLLSFLPQPIMYLIYFGLLCVVIASIYHAIRG